jgi:hypothetical protein
VWRSLFLLLEMARIISSSNKITCKSHSGGDKNGWAMPIPSDDKSYESTTFCVGPCVDGGSSVREEKFIHLPRDLANGYNVREGMTIELPLLEYVWDMGGRVACATTIVNSFMW